MANELYHFITWLLQDKAHRLSFYHTPESAMDASHEHPGLSVEQRRIMLTLDRRLICRHLLNEELPAGNVPKQDYEDLVRAIEDDDYGYSFTRDGIWPYFGAMGTTGIVRMAAAAWSDPEPKIEWFDPIEAPAGSDIAEFRIHGEGLFQGAEEIRLVQAVPNSPYMIRIPSSEIWTENSVSYRHRTLVAKVPLGAAPKAMYGVYVLNAPWWILQAKGNFEIK